MSSRKSLLLVVIAATLPLVLTSCSGLHSGGGGGGGGNSMLSLTISDTPPTNTSVMSFSLPIIGITLTPSSGSPVSVFSPSSSANYELTRLQSDTNLITVNPKVAAGTYTAVNVTVAGPSGVFYNTSSTKFGTCIAGAVCDITGSAATITYKFPTSSPLVLSGNTNQWLNLDFNYNNAIVSTNGISIDVTQANVLTALTTVPSGVSSGNFANIDDFTGSVTAISSSSITLQSSVRGSLTAALTSTTPVYDPQAQCSGGGSLSCITKGSIVSVQAVLSNTGVVNATSLDVIDASSAPADEVEGMVYGLCPGGNSYGLILSDSTIFTASSPLTSATFGQVVCLTPSQAAGFSIDTGILTGQSGVPVGNAGFTSGSDIYAGQTIRAKITGATSGTNVINATATDFILRFSRITVTVGTPGSLTFSVSALPPFMASEFTTMPQVQTYQNATLLEGITSINSLQSGQTVSISALLLNPATAGTQFLFQAAKVRLS
jgi:Domain of unknown function (DUF4382)